MGVIALLIQRGIDPRCYLDEPDPRIARAIVAGLNMSEEDRVESLLEELKTQSALIRKDIAEMINGK